MKIRVNFCALCLMIACAITPARALTLNEIELNSFLNQILDARIGLTEIKSGEIDGLNLRIIESTNATGQLSSMLKLEVKEDGKGRYIHVTSQENIREPILSFSVELSWSEGRLIRDYSVLMDPKK
jgi:pilus assembly protein FimV